MHVHRQQEVGDTVSNMDVHELIEALLPFTIPIVDNTNPDKPPRLSYLVPTAETDHRRYTIKGVRASSEGDPVIMIEFVD